MGLLDQFRTIFTKSGQATSAPDKGEANNPTQDRRSRPRVNPREGTRVLLIDDSPTILTALKRILQSAGCQVLEAMDAESGLETALLEKPDLIFLDIVLPGMNGFAALRALRKDPLLRDIPVIMISGNEQATEQFFGTRIGADDFMKKPFSRFEVFARIERLLDADHIPRRPADSHSHRPLAQPGQFTSSLQTQS